MAYDFHYPVLKFHQFDRHFRKASGICPVRQLVDVVRFACQFAEDVRILPVQPGRYLCRHDSLPHILADTQPGLDVFARIVVSDKTLWQQVFR
jgi:hypothetical protein